MLLVSFLNITCISSDIHKTYKFTFSNLSIENVFTDYGTFSIISLDDNLNQNLPGSPSLPYVSKAIAIPVGESIGEISVSYHLKGTYILPHPVVPEQEFTTTSEEPSFCYNVSSYKKTSEFDDLVTYDIQYLRGYEILNINIRPVNYNSVENKILFYDLIAVIISPGREDALPSPMYRNLGKDFNYLSTIVENPNEILPFGYDNIYDGGICDPSEKYDYVIITNEALNDSWQPLIDHRINNSLNCTKVTVENIDDCIDYWNETSTFNDTQAHIREFCKDAYLDWETDYILLGGDWDGSNQIVPYRLFTDRFETLTYDSMPCDMYYSHLDGDWYYSAGSIWGGGADSGVNDKYSELFISRIAAYNTTMVSNAINKIIWYDNCNDADWLNKASFWGGNLGWTVTSKQYMEELRLGTDTFRNFVGFEEWNENNSHQIINSETLYHADLGSNYLTYFSNSVENNNFSILSHVDHSNYNTPFGMTNWQYRYNTKPFFGYSQGCLAGRFSSGYAGCEQLICRHNERHAFALVLNTGYGYCDTEQTDGPGQMLHCYFWDYFFNSTSDNQAEWQIGKAQAYSDDKYSYMIDGTHHAWCYNWYSSHLFGDPYSTLRIATTNEVDTPFDLNPHGHIGDEDGTVLLNCTVTDNEKDVMTIYFYNYSDNSTIDFVENITDGNIASVNWSGLQSNLNYTFYCRLYDGFNWSENSSMEWFYFTDYPAWDINQDAVVNYLDLSLLVADYGETGFLPADINSDEVVDYLDVSMFVNHYLEEY